MQQFLQMDIFFFITSCVVFVLGLLIAMILYKVWKILGHVEKVAREASEETVLLRGDIAQLRDSIRQEGARLRSVPQYLTQLVTLTLKRFMPRSRHKRAE